MKAKLTVINSDGKESLALPAPDGIEVRLQDLRFRAFARDPYEQLLVELGHVDAAEQALGDHPDALLVDTVGDYAIERMRAISPVPVFGAGEAGIAEASAGSRRFSIVTVWPSSMRWLYDERLALSTGGDCCAGVHHLSAESELSLIGTEDGVKARMVRREESTVDTIVAACRRAIEADGSEAILLGCTCMSPVASAIQERCSFPIIDASAAGLRAAYSELSRRDASPAPAATRRAGAVPPLIDMLLAAGHVPLQDECQVCTIASLPEPRVHNDKEHPVAL